MMTDDGRPILYNNHQRRCCICTFRIEVGDPIVMDKWGWVHPVCLLVSDE
jgi:hypothetical protein